MGMKQIFKSQLKDNDITAMEALGTIRIELNSVYKYVSFNGTNAVAAGDTVCYVLSDTTLQTVDHANSALAAGIAMNAAVAGSATYGWVQIEGVSGSNLSWTVPGAVGNSLTTSGAAAPAMVVLDTTTATALLAASALVVVPGVAGTGIISCSFKH